VCFRRVAIFALLCTETKWGGRGAKAERRARAYVGAKFNAHGRRRGGARCFPLVGPGRERAGDGSARCGTGVVWGPGRAQAKWCGGGSKRAPSRTVRLPRRLSLARSRARRVAASQADGWRAGRLGGLVGTARQPSQPDTRCPSRDRWRGTRLGGGGSGAPRGGGPRGGRAGRRGAMGVPAVPPARRTWGAARLVGHRGGPGHVSWGWWWGLLAPPSVPCHARRPRSPRAVGTGSPVGPWTRRGSREYPHAGFRINPNPVTLHGTVPLAPVLQYSVPLVTCR
jgi:hypothetical protein